MTDDEENKNQADCLVKGWTLEDFISIPDILHSISLFIWKGNGQLTPHPKVAAINTADVLRTVRKKSWARKSKSKVEIDQTKPYQSELCRSTFFSVCTFPMPTERYEVRSTSRRFVLTFQQLCEWFWTRGGDGERELVHGNAVSYRQGVNLPVGHLASQQLPQQDSKTGRRDAERGKVKMLSIYWSISIATWKNPV